MFSEIPYGGWKRNLKIADGAAELVVTLDVGPRILFAAPVGGRNLFAELPEQLGKSGEQEWQIRGGHRFWTAPENDESYALDNAPVDYAKLDDKTVQIVSPASPFGWQKTLVIRSEGGGPLPGLPHPEEHRREAGRGNPLGPLRDGARRHRHHPAASLRPPSGRPASRRPLHQRRFPGQPKLVLWKYTPASTTPRFTLGQNHWHVRQVSPAAATKFGLWHEGWVAYQLGTAFFAKTVPALPAPAYPDQGVNFELFTNGTILELETLAPPRRARAGREPDPRRDLENRNLGGAAHRLRLGRPFLRGAQVISAWTAAARWPRSASKRGAISGRRRSSAAPSPRYDASLAARQRRAS